MKRRRSTLLEVGDAAPNCEVVIEGRQTELHAFRSGAPLALIFLRHLQ